MSTSSLPSLRQYVKDVVTKAGVWGEIPVPVEHIAASLRLMTMVFEPTGQFADMAGAINHEQGVIYFRAGDPAVRQRFTIAHEIGHAVLHKGKNLVDYRMNIDTPRDLCEIEANNFAAELLMPAEFFGPVWESRDEDVQRVATHFGVSTDAARFRAINLGLARLY